MGDTEAARASRAGVKPVVLFGESSPAGPVCKQVFIYSTQNECENGCIVLDG